MASSSSSSSSSSFSFYSLKLSMALMMLVILSLSTATTAQVQDCVNKLVPCGNYIKTNDTPPATCCSSIKDAVANQLKCLCTLYQTPGLLESFNLTVTEALNLATRCGVTSDLSNCTAALAPTATPPPPVPGNDGSKMAWMGLWSFILIWASMMFF